MSNFVDQLIDYLENLSRQIPLEIFTIVGSFIEEIIAPIPSPLVMTLAGSITESQGRPLIYLLVVAVIGAAAKSVASWLLYIIANKAENIVLGKFGKMIGITSKEIESIGKMFKGGIRDWMILFFARAIPVMPTSPISVVAGVIKLPMRMYLVASFFGLIVRNLCFLYLGYLGLETANEVTGSLDSAESIVKVVVVGGLAIGFGYLYYKRKKGNPFSWLQRTKKTEK